MCHARVAMTASQANANDTVLDPSYVLGKCSGRKRVCVSAFGCQQICYSSLSRQNTTLLLIFQVREIRYYPSIECMILMFIIHRGCFMLSPGPLQFEATLPVAFECIGYLEHVSDSAHSGLLDLKTWERR